MLLISKMQIKALGGQTLPMTRIKEIEENNKIQISEKENKHSRQNREI